MEPASASSPHGSSTKLELSDGSSLYAKLVVILLYSRSIQTVWHASKKITFPLFLCSRGVKISFILPCFSWLLSLVLTSGRSRWIQVTCQGVSGNKFNRMEVFTECNYMYRGAYGGKSMCLAKISS